MINNEAVKAVNKVTAKGELRATLLKIGATYKISDQEKVQLMQELVNEYKIRRKIN